MTCAKVCTNARRYAGHARLEERRRFHHALDRCENLGEVGCPGGIVTFTKGTTRHINQMRQDVIFADYTVPARYKALAAMLWAVSARCEPCFKFYVGR